MAKQRLVPYSPLHHARAIKPISHMVTTRVVAASRSNSGGNGLVNGHQHSN